MTSPVKFVPVWPATTKSPPGKAAIAFHSPLRLSTRTIPSDPKLGSKSPAESKQRSSSDSQAGVRKLECLIAEVLVDVGRGSVTDFCLRIASPLFLPLPCTQRR